MNETQAKMTNDRMQAELLVTATQADTACEMTPAEFNRRDAKRTTRETDPETGVQRDTSGAIIRGLSLPCGCPLDSDCTGNHPGALS